MSEDERWMGNALKEAQKAYEKGEVPVGAVLVCDERLIAKGHNQVETLKDATAHAEMICLTAGAAALDNWRLKGTTLYCTLEPCSMCAGALLLARVDRLVWAAEDLRHGANGSWIDLFAKKHPTHQIDVVGGILKEPAALLMRQFFQEQRSGKRKRD